MIEYLSDFELYILKPDALLMKSPEPHKSVGGGIYALFNKDDELLYIGKALSLNLRINQHFYAKKHNFSYYSAVDVPAEMMRDIEVAHIYALSPPGNNLYERIDNPRHDSMVAAIREAWGVSVEAEE